MRVTGIHDRLLDDAQRALEPDHAEAGLLPGALLRFRRVRRVIRGDDVDRAVGEGRTQGLHVLIATQGRVHLEAGVVAPAVVPVAASRDQLVGQQQVVRGHLGGDRDPSRLGPADDVDAAGRREVADVQPGAGGLGQQHVARDDGLLGDRGHPASPSSALTTPSFIWAPSVRRGSWACWAMTPPNVLTYSSARRMSRASCTHRPSSENTRTAARDCAIAPISLRRSPSSPTVTAPMGRTVT